MTSVVIRAVVLAAFLAASGTLAQRRGGFPQPPQPGERSSTPTETKPVPLPRVDPLELQREARELAELAQTVPLDVDKVNHGLLPKDTGEKLKRIEKLAKRLRGELTP